MLMITSPSKILLSCFLLLSQANAHADSRCAAVSPISMLSYVVSKQTASTASEPFAIRARELLNNAKKRSEECGCEGLSQSLAKVSDYVDTASDELLFVTLKNTLPRLRQEAMSCPSP